MTAAELSLSYEPEDDWHGQLGAVVRSGEFSGKGTAWFGRAQLRETFVSALREFPLSANAPPLIEGGFWSKGKTLDQCHLRIAVRLYNSLGTLIVQVDLASPCWKTPDQDRQQSITARLLTDYASLDAFAVNFSRVLDGDCGAAVLQGIVNR
jgi:hypothetical protein